jgi:hypothetical protein
LLAAGVEEQLRAGTGWREHRKADPGCERRCPPVSRRVSRLTLALFAGYGQTAQRAWCFPP